MQRVIFLALLFLVVAFSLSAQDDVTNRLRQPSAEEYIQRTIEIAALPSASEWDRRNFYTNLTVDIFRRFPNLNHVDFEHILSAYDAMGIGGDGYFGSRGYWVEWMVGAWLAQNQPDLSNLRELRFENFHIQILSYDFNKDGRNEYVLDVTKGKPTDRMDCRYEADYVNYLVVRQTPDGYQLVETPLDWDGYGTDSSFTNLGEGGTIELNFEDINADGLPEWMVIIGGETFGGPGAGYENVGQLYILGWRDDRLMDLAALGDVQRYPYSVTVYSEDDKGCNTPIPEDVNWELVNLDDDPAQEILQHQVYLDSWGCIARETKVIDWDTTQDRYVQIDTRRDFPYASQNCARRKAEEAMWAGNYTQALQYYEHALTLQPYIDPDETSITARAYYREAARNRRTTYDQYHRARMALAYRMIGQPEKAHLILEALQTETFSHEPIQYFVEALAQAPDTPFATCLVAYDTFARHIALAHDSSDYYFGVTLEQYFESYYVSYSPARIGCDALPLLAVELQTRTFSGNRLPVEHVSDLGLVVRDTVQADLNGDGEDEWLVWPETPMHPLFFALDDSGHYHVSTPAVDPFHNAVEIQPWLLPNEHETAIATVVSESSLYFQEPWACAYDIICGRGGYPYTCLPDGTWYLSLWRMSETDLTLTPNTFEVCRRDLATLFPDGEGSTLIDGGEIIWEQDALQNRLVRFEWDVTTKAFLNDIPNTPVPTVNATATPPTEPKYRYIFEALEAKDYPEALVMLDHAIARNLDNPDYHYRYQRGFVLEKLNRPDEALAEYVAIYEAAPDSAWGMLAALHLEVVETE